MDQHHGILSTNHKIMLVTRVRLLDMPHKGSFTQVPKAIFLRIRRPLSKRPCSNKGQSVIIGSRLDRHSIASPALRGHQLCRNFALEIHEVFRLPTCRDAPPIRTNTLNRVTRQPAITTVHTFRRIHCSITTVQAAIEFAQVLDIVIAKRFTYFIASIIQVFRHPGNATDDNRLINLAIARVFHRPVDNIGIKLFPFLLQERFYIGFGSRGTARRPCTRRRTIRRRVAARRDPAARRVFTIRRFLAAGGFGALELATFRRKRIVVAYPDINGILIVVLANVMVLVAADNGIATFAHIVARGLRQILRRRVRVVIATVLRHRGETFVIAAACKQDGARHQQQAKHIQNRDRTLFFHFSPPTSQSLYER